MPTGDAPTTSEWSTIQLPTKVPLILETWRYPENWALSQYKDLLSWHRDSHYKDETVIRPSYLYIGNPWICKTTTLFWNVIYKILAILFKIQCVKWYNSRHKVSPVTTSQTPPTLWISGNKIDHAFRHCIHMLSTEMYNKNINNKCFQIIDYLPHLTMNCLHVSATAFLGDMAVCTSRERTRQISFPK